MQRRAGEHGRGGECKHSSHQTYSSLASSVKVILWSLVLVKAVAAGALYIERLQELKQGDRLWRASTQTEAPAQPEGAAVKDTGTSAIELLQDWIYPTFCCSSCSTTILYLN